MTEEHHQTSPQNNNDDIENLRHQNQLYEEYFNALDSYSNAQTKIASHIAQGFLDLAKANYNSTSKQYGQIYYDNRMKALATVHIDEGQLSLNRKESDINEKSKENEIKSEKSDISEESHINTEKKMDDEQETKSALKDPINMFGVFVPQSLRTAQEEFKQSLQNMIECRNALNKLQKSEIKIKKLKES